MARERCLKKSFKDSLEDIKERMKEKRNQKWAKLGKTNQALSVKGKIADNSSALLKSFQANNHALAVALEEEKIKMKEAQDIILNLKKEYQHLKCQMFVLQRMLELQQGKEHAETRLVALKKIISKVVQDLLNATNLGPAKDACTTDCNQILSASDLADCSSSSFRNQDSLVLPRHALALDVTKQDNMLRTKMQGNINNNYSDFLSDPWQDVENTSPAITPQIDTGQQQRSCEDHLDYESADILSNEENQHVGNSLSRNVSTRRRYLRNKPQNDLSLSDGNVPEISEQINNPCQQDKTGPETGLGENNEQYEENDLCQENKHNINTDQSLQQSKTLIETNTLMAAPKQANLNCTGSSKKQKEKSQKRKLETLKSLSRTRTKKDRSCNKRHCSKEKADASVGSSDAYDFIFEEGVHVTPFRQNKENENSTNGKNYTEETEKSSGDSFISEEDSDDSLYVPYSKKSKSGKNLTCTDISPVHTRPRLKKTVYEQRDKNTEEKNKNTKKPENSFSKKTNSGTLENARESSSSKQNSGSNVAIKVDAVVPCSAPTVRAKEEVCSRNSSHENGNFEEDRPSEALQTHRLRLGDVTNLESSSSGQTRLSHPPVNMEINGTSYHKRRCTLSVSYKEPTLSGKLRRGDPFTDTGFLNSPIFKEKKSKCKSVKKQSLSRYNEAFVGCL